MHFLTLFWKVIFATIPPAGLGAGYPCFVISIAETISCTSLPCSGKLFSPLFLLPDWELVILASSFPLRRLYHALPYLVLESYFRHYSSCRIGSWLSLLRHFHCGDYIMHFLTLFWKVIFATIPPAGLGAGYLCFVISIAMIGVCTAVIGDVAGHLGCFIYLKDSV